MNKRPPKVADVKREATEAEASGLLRFSVHALERMKERNIMAVEVRQVIARGYHEAKKDSFDELHGAWNYALRGKTLEGRNLRIAVAVEAPNVLVITTIDLDKE